MRLIDLLRRAPALALGLAACTQDNPLFDDCMRRGTCVADERGDSGEARADEDERGDGSGGSDGTPGDGDGEPGDGDGDGDGEPGDGDGEPGDGDGDDETGPLDMLPTCPATMQLDLPLIEDTFLVHDPHDGGHCQIDWDLEGGQASVSESPLACKYLDFGGKAQHPVCSGGAACSSLWLGRFDVAVNGWDEALHTVNEASVTFTAFTDVLTPTDLSLFPLDVPYTTYQDCLDWSASDKLGEPPDACGTTWWYAAKEATWPVGWPFSNLIISWGNGAIPAGEMSKRTIIVPLAKFAAQAWIDQGSHPGLLLRSATVSPLQFVLLGHGTSEAPTLSVQICAKP